MPSRVLFVHAGGRRQRLLELAQGCVMAREFFYGLPGLRDMGIQVDLLDIDELQPEPRGFRYRWASYKDRCRTRITELNHCEHLFVGAEDRLRDYDVVIAGTEYVALGLVDVLRRLPRSPALLFLVMGMLSKPLVRLPAGSARQRSALRRYGHLLQHAKGALFLGRAEYQAARTHFPALHDRLSYVAFGVDTDFWTPDPTVAQGRTILFVGNDANRDTDMLVRIAEAMPGERFVALTSLLKGRKVPPNLEVIASGWKQGILTDEEVRQHYRQAAVVILPVKETLQPSGQSVAMQAMACACPVVISDFPGFWDRQTVSENDGIRFAYPNSAETFVGILTTLLADPEGRKAMGEQGRKMLLSHYSLTGFTERLADAVMAATGKPTARRAIEAMAVS